jgi:hypothetical protein
MASTLDDLVLKLQRILGDVPHKGNTQTWDPDQCVKALNWAQDRYCEATKCTFSTVDLATDEDGLIPIGGPLSPSLATSMKIVSVLFPDDGLDEANAIIGLDANPVPHGDPVVASVTEQPGATYFWSVAGGTITSGQGTYEATITTMNVIGVTSIGVTVQLNDTEASSSVDVVLT